MVFGKDRCNHDMASSVVAIFTLENIVEYLLIGVFAFSLLSLIGYWLVEGLVYLWFSVKVLKSDTLPIELVASTPGPIEIAGTARVADEVVRAPFSDVECLACEYEITKWRPGSDQSQGYDETIYEGRIQTRFYVEDETARVLVDPAGAMFNFEDHETSVFLKQELPESFQQFLEEHPEYDLDAGRSRSTQTFLERRLEPGEQVHVYGVARYDPTVSKHAGTVNAIIDAPPTPSRSLLARLRARATTPPYVISDTDERAALRRLLAGAGFNLGILIAILLFVVFLL